MKLPFNRDANRFNSYRNRKLQTKKSYYFILQDELLNIFVDKMTIMNKSNRRINIENFIDTEKLREYILPEM